MTPEEYKRFSKMPREYKNGNMKSNLGLTCFQVADGSY